MQHRREERSGVCFARMVGERWVRPVSLRCYARGRTRAAGADSASGVKRVGRSVGALKWRRRVATLSQRSTDYVVFTAMSSSWGERSGVVVKRGGRRLRAMACRGPVVSVLGIEVFRRGQFQIDLKEFSPPE